MLNQTVIVASRFLPVVCRCESPKFETDGIIGDPTNREIPFCIFCGNAKNLDDALFQARVAVNPQFDHDLHVLDYLINRLAH